ncbi:hypothetical protein ASPNIDRAFT_39182 [Aspergillus niger ATCC 1015]|uniref:Uncharacterized protein n=1 Tax=Aspergillus niger (strain ATCC 1015 / CBS 113.46 / FGSC A1144 / LSHB Ac4 / NCTC 3858a / NRRL 328 / USDA 3528.7) TaxID=380704 RepID=G3YD76_ASPNA|nr:hypothetical protein ASPNIDRAFT_39182 [Aspergillus niger ATCC 1015]
MHPPFLFLDNDRTIELSRTVVQPVGDAADVPTIRDRLGQHKLALERAGVTDLSTLGLMRLSGPVIPQVGVAVPEQDQYEAQMVPFQHAYKFDRMEHQLKARPLVVSGPEGPMLDDFRPDMRWGRELTTTHSLPTIYVDAYIAATQLKIEDDTQIVLKYPNKFLFLIAKEIQVGKDVTITWDRSLNNAPDPPNPPEKRPTAATPIRDDERTPGLWGVAGEMGLMERKWQRLFRG